MTHQPPEGCHLFPDGNWKDCCHTHNEAYALGGTRHDKARADRALRQCVASKGGLAHTVISWIMWLGVRIGGRLFWGGR